MDVSLEKLYSPSKWVKRCSPEDVVTRHVTYTAVKSEEARQVVPCELNNSYGSSPNEKIDLYGVDLPNDAPIFVYVSGGYWQELSGEISSYPAEPLHKAGILTAVVDYSRAPQVTVPTIVEQVVAACQWIVEYACQRGSKSITLAGHSAGSQLCAMVFSSGWYTFLSDEKKKLFRGVFHLSGVFDLRPLVETSVNDALKMSTQEAWENSPLREKNLKQAVSNLKDTEVNVLIAANDSPAFKEQAYNYTEKLKECGIKACCQTIPMVDHFDLVEKLSMDGYSVTKMVISSVNP